MANDQYIWCDQTKVMLDQSRISGNTYTFELLHKCFRRFSGSEVVQDDLGDVLVDLAQQLSKLGIDDWHQLTLRNDLYISFMHRRVRPPHVLRKTVLTSSIPLQKTVERNTADPAGISALSSNSLAVLIASRSAVDMPAPEDPASASSLTNVCRFLLAPASSSSSSPPKSMTLGFGFGLASSFFASFFAVSATSVVVVGTFKANRTGAASSVKRPLVFSFSARSISLSSAIC